MAKSWIWIDGAGGTHNLYIIGTPSNRIALRDTEEGALANYEQYSEALPSRFANRWRSTIWASRIYAQQFALGAGSAAEADTALGDWLDWHDPELGEGKVKRVLADGTTRVLDAVPLPTVLEQRVGHNMFIAQSWQADVPFWHDEAESSASGTMNDALGLLNPSFETFAGTADDGLTDSFTNWTASGTDASNLCEASGTAFAGTYAAMFTYVDGRPDIQSDNLGVTAAETYRLRFWTRGDGTEQGAYHVYDVANAADIIAITDTGVTSSDWDEVTKEFDAPAGCGTAYVRFYGPDAAGVAWIDDVRITHLKDIEVINTGDIAAFCRFELVGQMDTPRVTNSGGDYVRVKKITANADDEIHINCRPNGSDPYTVHFYLNGAGPGTFCASDSGSNLRTKLAKGTANFTAEHEGASGTAVCTAYWYNYYESLY